MRGLNTHSGSQLVWELAKRLTAHRKRHWTAGQGQVADCVEHGNEPLGFTNTRGDFSAP